METFGARAEKRNVLRKKTAADVLPLALLSGFFLCIVGSATQVCTSLALRDFSGFLYLCGTDVFEGISGISNDNIACMHGFVLIHLSVRNLA